MKPYYETKLGKLYWGDCLEIIPGLKHIDLVLTDPPFKISQSYTANVDADNLSAVSKIWPVGKELFKIAKDGSCFMMYYDTRILPLALEAMRWAKWKYLRGLTFYRRWGHANKVYGWMSTSDFILLFRKPSESKYIFYSDDWRHDVYTRSEPEKINHHHPAQKPISDVEHLILHLSLIDGLCIDPFLGSGTTAAACERLNRKWIGIETSEEYCEIAAKRIENERSQLKML